VRVFQVSVGHGLNSSSISVLILSGVDSSAYIVLSNSINCACVGWSHLHHVLSLSGILQIGQKYLYLLTAIPSLAGAPSHTHQPAPKGETPCRR
jgi:hypothetical protein